MNEVNQYRRQSKKIDEANRQANQQGNKDEAEFTRQRACKRNVAAAVQRAVSSGRRHFATQRQYNSPNNVKEQSANSIVLALPGSFLERPLQRYGFELCVFRDCNVIGFYLRAKNKYTTLNSPCNVTVCSAFVRETNALP